MCRKKITSATYIISFCKCIYILFILKLFAYFGIRFTLFLFQPILEMEHTFDFHITDLNKLFRACGERGHYLCTSFKNDLLLCHRINIDKDSESKHSTTLCSKCASRMHSLRKAVNDKTLSVALKLASDSACLWTHTRKIEQSTNHYHTIDLAITSYMSLYRQNSHNTITPKQHMLERHCLPFVER